MRGPGQVEDERRITLISFTVASLKHALLKERFQIVKHQQTASPLQGFDQQGERLFFTLENGYIVLLYQCREPVAQDVCEEGAICRRLHSTQSKPGATCFPNLTPQ